MTHKNNYIPIYVHDKCIARVKNGVLLKSIRTRHILQNPPAIAFDIASLLQAEQAGAHKVIVTNQDTGIRYTASLELIREKGFTFNRGHGEQIGLPLSSWVITRKGQIPAEQLALWRKGAGA